MRHYRTAVDGWILWMLHFTAGGSVVVAGLMWVRGGALLGTIAWSGTFLTVAAALYWILTETWYALDHRGLTIRSGPYRAFIPYQAIRGVAPTSSLLASPALSLRRLYIDFEGSPLGVRISPDDIDAFIADLASRCPHLLRDGYVLARRPQP